MRLDYEQAARYGVSPRRGAARAAADDRRRAVTQIVEGNRRFDLVVRLPDRARAAGAGADLLIETPAGRVPLSKLARRRGGDGPNQVSRENGAAASCSRPTPTAATWRA
jgi:HME family heavy-metal exporter